MTSERSLCRIENKSKYERPGPIHLRSFLCRVASSLLPNIGLFPMYAGDPWPLMHMTGAKTKGRQFCNNYDRSVIIGPITLKLRTYEYVGTYLAMQFHVSQLGCYCTCARARLAPRSRERPKRLRSNLVQ